MVDAVLLVLREILEAALIISLLMALSHRFKISYAWVYVAIVGGGIGSWGLAQSIYYVADLFDGIGQELINSALYLVVILSILALILLILPSVLRSRPTSAADGRQALLGSRHYYLLNLLFISIVGFSVMREAAEIWIYLSSFMQHRDALYSALSGAVIGAGIGMSLGAIAFYLLIFLPVRIYMPFFISVMTLLVGGLSMQIAKQFMQVGLLDSSAPLWDSSFLISEQSWLGELLYALLGYDAKPTSMQIIFYLLAVLPIVAAVFWHLIHVRVKANA